MNARLLKLIFSALFWVLMLISSGKIKELFEKKKIESLTAQSVSFSDEAGVQVLRFTIYNNTSSEVTYNTEGSLYTRRGDDLTAVPLKEHAAYSGASYFISPGDRQDYEICLTDYYDRLPAGDYRYCKTVGCLTVDVDFTVANPEKRSRRK